MATSSRLAREQVEKAFAAYLNDNRSGSPLASIPILVRKGKLLDSGVFELENVDDAPVPSVVVSCPRSKPHDMDYPVCELHIMSLTSTDEESAATKAADRFGFIAALLGQENTDAVISALNYKSDPMTGADIRAVKNFKAFGFYQTEDMGQETDRHWIDHLVFEVHCQPTDDLDGDGANG